MSELHQIERLQQQDWPRLKSLRLSSVVPPPGLPGGHERSEDAFWSGQVELACFVAHRLSPEERRPGVRGVQSTRGPSRHGSWACGWTRSRAAWGWVSDSVSRLGLGKPRRSPSCNEVHHSNRPATFTSASASSRCEWAGKGRAPERGVYRYLLWGEYQTKMPKCNLLGNGG